MESEKQQLMRALKKLIDGLEELTLSSSEYILIGELLEWYKHHKKEKAKDKQHS